MKKRIREITPTGDWIGQAFKGLLGDNNDYDDRKIGRIDCEDNGGIGVSSCWTDDFGWETALLDDNGTHPVERYTSRKLCQIGHKKWVKFTKNVDGKKVIELGTEDGLVDDEEIIIKAEK